jgi:hypothetical protein
VNDRRHRRRHDGSGRISWAASSSQSVRVGGDELDEAIVNYVKREYKVLIDADRRGGEA